MAREKAVIPRDQWIRRFKELIEDADTKMTEAYRAVNEATEFTWNHEIAEDDFTTRAEPIFEGWATAHRAAGDAMTGIAAITRMFEFFEGDAVAREAKRIASQRAQGRLTIKRT